MSESWKWTRKWTVLVPVFLVMLLVCPAFAQDAQPSGSPEDAAAQATSLPDRSHEAPALTQPTLPPEPTTPAEPAAPSEPPTPDVAAAAVTEPPEPKTVEPVVQPTPVVSPEPVAEPVSAPVTEPVTQPAAAVEPPPTPVVVVDPPVTTPATAVEPPSTPAVVVDSPVTPPATAVEPPSTPVVVVDPPVTTPEPAGIAPEPAPAAAVTPAAPVAGLGAKLAARPEGAKKEFIKSHLMNVFVFILVLLCLVVFFTVKASRGEELFIRRISGLSAIDDAVGRATEMGRGVLYIPGIMDMDDIQTIAGVTILGHVARKTAEYDTPLYAPMTRSFTMSVAQEVVKQSYLEKGRADAFRPDRIPYLTDDQFGFVAGVGGIMMREKPAACFYLGTFYAESLILAETGNSVGAIQIAGTAEPSQIPFFVAACDYTLIGEELFAASAYLSRNPKEVGSLKGQDWAKVLLIFLMLVGSILLTGDAVTKHFQAPRAEKSTVQEPDSLAQTYIKLFKK